MNSNDKQLKREWKLEQNRLASAAFPMPDTLLESLFNTVGARVGDSGCDHTLRFTERWIGEHGQSASSVLDWLKGQGGLCDCEVVANVADHWEQNR
ncbi:DUF2695 domain-containing protein [Roseateles sp.]|jgi:hypothetical protein|uniref:DUF2695 domain-containing protein n=1 Tax=Roseateles sp. TaxID=1971397 RepID=UPI0037CC4F06